MNVQEEIRNEVEVQPGWMRSYCEVEKCEGILVQMDSQEFDDDQECGICIESINRVKYVILSSCSHIFCESCITGWRVKHKDCPMCRVPVGTVWRFDQPRTPLNLDNLKPQDHMFCEINIPCPYAREYVSKLQGEWCRMFMFISRTQLQKDKYAGIKGVEHLDLKMYENEGRLLNKGDSYATLKTENGKIQVVCACRIPCLSFRLLITSNEDNEDIPVEVDNEYADTAVGYVTTQLDACWKVLPQLFDHKALHRTYIRKFETHTVCLCLAGIEDMEDGFEHIRLMKEQIKSLNDCNFDPSFHDTQLRRLPRLDYANCRPSDDYDYDNCSCFPQMDDDSSEGDEGSNNDNESKDVVSDDSDSNLTDSDDSDSNDTDCENCKDDCNDNDVGSDGNSESKQVK